MAGVGQPFVFRKHPSLGKNTIKRAVIILAIIITFNSILTYQRNKFWKNEITLWNDAMQKSPYKAKNHLGLGINYAKEGNLTQTLSSFNKAIEIDPNYVQAYNNRANAYSQQGNLQQALSDYNKALGIDPNYVEALSNRAIVYDQLKEYATRRSRPL